MVVGTILLLMNLENLLIAAATNLPISYFDLSLFFCFAAMESTRNLPHLSFSLETPNKPLLENEVLTKSPSSSGLYKNLSCSVKSFNGEYLSISLSGYKCEFNDPFTPSQSMQANENFMAWGSSGSYSVCSSQNFGMPNCNPTIFFHDSCGQPLDCVGYIESADPDSFNRRSCFNDEDLNKKLPDPKDEPLLKRTRKGGIKSVKKRLWTSEEDSQLIELVREFGDKQWSVIAPMFNRREGKQCRERWFNHLRPDIKKGRITEEEELVIVDYLKRHSSSWVSIAEDLPGRTENAIKNHVYASRRRAAKLKYTPKTYLEKYLKNSNVHTADVALALLAEQGKINDLKSSSADFPGSQLPSSIIQTVDASSGFEDKDQMLPGYDVDVALRYVVEDEMHSEKNTFTSMLSDTPNVFSVNDDKE